DNVERVIAIEFMTAMQGLDFRDLPSSDVIEEVKKEYRETVPTVDNDRVLHFDMVKTVDFLRSLDVTLTF
nr:histidine ammonia-lyase [Saprospiraceae bacterium]